MKHFFSFIISILLLTLTLIPVLSFNIIPETALSLPADDIPAKNLVRQDTLSLEYSPLPGSSNLFFTNFFDSDKNQDKGKNHKDKDKDEDEDEDRDKDEDKDEDDDKDDDKDDDDDKDESYTASPDNPAPVPGNQPSSDNQSSDNASAPVIPSDNATASDNTTIPSENTTAPVVTTPPFITNQPPRFGFITNDIYAMTGLVLQFTVSAYDPEDDALTYAASNLPEGASFDAGTRVFSWTPESVGIYDDIEFSVNDGNSGPVTATITIMVLDSSLFQGKILYGMNLINADGTDKISLGTGGSIAVSPDGNKIIFMDTGKIYVMNVDGSNRINLGDGTSPDWSPDGRKIVYTDAGKIYVINADGSNKTDLGEGDFPDWSPDGGKIVFVKADNIYVINADGSNVVPLTDNGSSGSPSWNPQGTKIMFGSSGQLWLMDGDGGNQVKVANSVYIPVWSPDGTKIAYFDGDVNICGLDGSIIASAGEYASFGFQIKWAPDSQAVAFIGTSQRILTLLHVDGRKSSISGTVSSFAFSPDGRWVCYKFDIRNDLFISSYDGRTTIKLTDEPPGAVAMFWFIPGSPSANNPPTLSPIGDKTVEVDKQMELSLSATDPDGDELEYSAANLPEGASFNPENRTFAWTPSEAGTYAGVHFEVSDGELTDFEDITINVTEAVTAPAKPPVPQYSLTINITGRGAVTRSPDQGTYAAGTTVQLTAYPDPDYIFCGWSGAVSGSANTATITMSSNVTVNAIFAKKVIPAPPQAHTATVTIPVAPVTTIIENESTVIINIVVLINQEGKSTADIDAVSIDANVWINIPLNTVCRDRDGNPLATVTIQKLTSVPGGVTADGLIGAVYFLAPDGATFNPAVVLFFKYDPSTLPAGTSEEDIVIVWWDENAGKWVALATLVDTENNVLQALITHTSYYSLAIAAPATATATAGAATQPAQTQPGQTQTGQAATGPAATASPDATNGNDGEDTGGFNLAVTLMVIGGLLFIGVIVAMVLVYRRNSHNRPDNPGGPPVNDDMDEE